MSVPVPVPVPELALVERLNPGLKPEMERELCCLHHGHTYSA